MTASQAAKQIADAPAPVRNVVLVIANLGWGGAQKVLINMANHWAAMNWKVTLISIDRCLYDSYFPIDPAVQVVYLGVAEDTSSPMQALIVNRRRVVVLREAIAAAEPELVVSFLSSANVLTLLAASKLGLPVIVSERGDPGRASLPKAWRCLRRLTYPRAHRLVAQTDAALGFFPPAIRRRGEVLPNPVDVPERPAACKENSVVGVGHLTPVKGFDLLIRAFAKLAPAHSHWRLCLWGVGKEEEGLCRLADEHGLADRVDLPGKSASPGSWINSSGIFALSSRHEGFPNALLEAMAHGLPVIAADCPIGGPRAMIEHETNGLLVAPDNVDALADGLQQMLANETFRQRLGRAARQSVKDRYAMPTVMARWTSMIDDVMAEHG